MSVVLEKVGNVLQLQASAREKDLVRRIPGGTFDRAAGAWTFAPAVSVCLIARDVFKDRLEVGPALCDWFAVEYTHLDYLSALKVTDYEYPPELYPFQRQGTTWLWAARQALLTDEMGLGKTIQTLRCGLPDNSPTLVVCTNSMKMKWAEEARAWQPGSQIVVIGGTATQRRKQLDFVKDLSRVVNALNATLTESTTERASAGSAGCGTTESEIGTSSGTTKEPGTPKATDDPSGSTSSSGSTDSPSKTTKPCSKSKKAAASYAESFPYVDPWLLTMTTEMAVSEDFSATTATWLSDGWKAEGKDGWNGLPLTLIVTTNWESLRLHSRLAPYGSIELTEAERTPKELDDIGFRTVIADEVHRACLPKSKQTRAWWNLSHKAEYRYGLTGTPIRNRPDDMWPILHGLLPAEFPRKSAWVDRYCHAGQNMWGAYEIWGLKEEHKAELFSYLDPRLMRRTKAEVLPQLPAKTYSTRVVEMEGKQAKAYKDMKKEMLTDVDGEFLTADSPLTLAGRLVQLAAATPVLGEVPWTDPETGVAGTRTGVVSLTTPSCKLDALLDVLDEAPGEPLVVFASSRKLIDLCAEKLDKEKVSYVLLTGAISPGARSQSVALFQEGEAQVALCTLGAASEGITLTRASRALFLQRSWSLVQNKQAEDRIHRIGQDAEKVEIIDIVTAGTIEDDVREAGELKEGYLQEIVRDHVRGKA